MCGDEADRQSTNLARQTHRMFDTQRRLEDAQRLLDEHQEKNTNELETWKAKWKR